MDSEELEAAVRAGVITPDTARELRNLRALRRGTSEADEERFASIGLADVMTAAGLALAMAPVAFAAFAFGAPGLVAAAAIAWALAEQFTRRQRLTLASFVLFAAFAALLAMALTHVSYLVLAVTPESLVPSARTIPPVTGLIVAAGCAFGCFAWWVRFRFAFAFAAAMVATVNLLVHVLRLAVPAAPAPLVSVVLLIAGLLLFAMAMWWDMSDVRRETRRAVVGFWLHCAAGFQIAGASFRLLLGVEGAPQGWDRLYAFSAQAPVGVTAVAVLALFLLLCAVALIVDRRSLMLSSLAFVFPATLSLVQGAPLVAAGVIGVVLVAFAGLWNPLRAALLARVPAAVRAQVPRTGLTHARPRPVL